MLLKKTVLFRVFLFFINFSAFCQGAILDEESYNTLPRLVPLSQASYEGLPSSFSLKQYAPLPGDQADYGTCVAWAAGYAARTICESVALNRLNQTETTQNAFSPVFIYKNICPDDPQGVYGSQIYRALDLMRDTGAVKMIDMERYLTFPRVDLYNYKNLKLFPIGDYLTLFSKEDRKKPALIPQIVKKSIVEGKPVIIGMNTPDSFDRAKRVWEPHENPGDFYYGHALCVVGYDDNKYGGAFEVLNSWGQKWGNGGYIWIPYAAFVDFVNEGYQIIENISNFSDEIKFSGFLRMETDNLVDFTLDSGGYYKTKRILRSGTNYRIIIGANESAYVYSFSVFQPLGDSRSYSPRLIFPKQNISPLLNYQNSEIRLPDENSFYALNGQTGTEYIITLYSKQSLDIQTIMRDFEEAQGAMNKRLAKSVNHYSTIMEFSENGVSFFAEPDNPRSVFALIAAIEHH